MELADIRPFQESDYGAYAAFLKCARPEAALTEVELRHLDRAYATSDVWERHLLADGGRIVASVFLSSWPAGERQCRVDLIVHPNAAVHLLSPKLYRFALERLKAYRPRAVVTRVREDWALWRKFYLDHGFHELERMWESRLDVTRFDASRARFHLERAEAKGFRFRTLADFPDEESTSRLSYDTTIELLADVPTAEPLNIWPYAVWRERYWNSPNRRPDSYFIALREDDVAGVSELRPTDEADKLATGLTGVKRPYRHQGLALALKHNAIVQAKRRGITTITTQNHSINRAMIAINTHLGFERGPAWIVLKKALAGD